MVVCAVIIPQGSQSQIEHSGQYDSKTLDCKRELVKTFTSPKRDIHVKIFLSEDKIPHLPSSGFVWDI